MNSKAKKGGESLRPRDKEGAEWGKRAEATWFLVTHGAAVWRGGKGFITDMGMAGVWPHESEGGRQDWLLRKKPFWFS